MEVTNDLLTMDDLPGQCGRPIVQTIWDVTCRNIHTPAGCDIWIPKYGPDPHILTDRVLRLLYHLPMSIALCDTLYPNQLGSGAILHLL